MKKKKKRKSNNPESLVHDYSNSYSRGCLKKKNSFICKRVVSLILDDVLSEVENLLFKSVKFQQFV